MKSTLSSEGTSAASRAETAVLIAAAASAPVVRAAVAEEMPEVPARAANLNASSSGTALVRTNSPAREPKAMLWLSSLSIASTLNILPLS